MRSYWKRYVRVGNFINMNAYMKQLTLGVLLLVLFAANAPTYSHAAVVTFLTSGTSYATPSDWNNTNNSIECIGAGGDGGSANNGGGGGGGGAYAKITNLAISGSISYSVAAGGSQADTTFNSTSLVCDAGNDASGGTDGTAGLASNSTGTTKFDGGAGGGGGGGGAGGTTSSGSSGSGGNGGNGGTVSGGTGGSYDLGSGAAGENGGSGTVWQVSPARGAGGGGAEGGPGEADIGCLTNGGNGGDGGGFGGGAGGGGARGSVQCLPGNGGFGSQGIIVTTYTPFSNVIVRGIGIFAGSSLTIFSGGITIY